MNQQISPLQIYFQLLSQLQQPQPTKERPPHVPKPRKPAPHFRAALVARQKKARP